MVSHQDVLLRFELLPNSPFPAAAPRRTDPITFLSHRVFLGLCFFFYCLSLVQTALGEGKRKDKVAARASVPVSGQAEPELGLLFPYRGKTLSRLETGSVCAQAEFPSASSRT